MSKMSLDFEVFCDVNQHLRARCFLADLLGNRILLQQGQKVMVCDLWLVDYDPFCVFIALNFRVHVFLNSAVGLRAPCLVDREDLCFDVLLCDVNFSHLSSDVFLPPYWNMASLDSQGEIVPKELPNPEETGMGGWKQISTFLPTF